jgi:hypothetical protein
VVAARTPVPTLDSLYKETEAGSFGGFSL